jgi:hypothetical protein
MSFFLPNAIILQNDTVLHQETISGNMTANGQAETVVEGDVATPKKRHMKWGNVILLTVIHLLAMYGILVVLPRAKLASTVWRKWH